MEYITHVTRWSKEKGEYMQENTTPDTLSGYFSCGMFFNTPLKLFAIGGNENDHFCDNWDIYADTKGYLYSIARQAAADCKNSYFGDVKHIKRLMRQGYFSDTLTDYGKKLMEV